MTDSASWLDDDDALERELRVTLAVHPGQPDIPGYVELRELARGGQGIVYAALQLSTRRTVAIKIHRGSLADDGRLLQRFEREAALAATLRHPHIVALHDSGVTADGRPYFVMELVDGPTIEHAAAVLAARRAGLRRPALDELLRLFLATCEAVAYAHRHGVVHRDLKPSNIRVDGEGHAKVLDFGLAKNLRPDSGSPVLTLGATGSTFVGSLPWASPEQALGRNRDIDTRSDVYALGVILYQLLTDRLPYDVESDLRTALDSIVHAPPARLRRIEPAISADLETIVLRCLQKDPERRYQSAGELARDLRNLLDGRLIDARRDSTWYTLRALARRHRGGVVAAALVAIALVTGLVIALVALRTVDLERARAVANAERAEASMRYFADTLIAVDPDRDGKDVRVLDMVQRAADDLKNRFADDPDTKGYFYIKLIELLRNLGASDAAQHLADEALAFARTTYGDPDPNTVFAIANRALLLHHAGRSAEVVADLEAAARLVRADPARYPAAARHVFVNLGYCLIALDRIDDAERAFRDAQALPTDGSPQPQLEAATFENLAAIAGYHGNNEEAIRLLEPAVRILAATNGPEHSSTVRATSNLAYYLAEVGRLDDAEQRTRDNLAICRRRFGDRSAITLTFLNNHANYLERLGRLDEAQAEYAECLAGRIETLTEEHPHTIVTLGNLASVASLRGDYPTAIETYRRVIAVSQRVRGPAHSETLILENNFAHTLQQSGDTKGAIELLRRVVTDATATLGDDHWQTALFRGNLGTDLFQDGDVAAAEPLLRNSVAVLDARLGADAGHTSTMKRRLAQLLRETGREAEAREFDAKPEAPAVVEAPRADAKR